MMPLCQQRSFLSSMSNSDSIRGSSTTAANSTHRPYTMGYQSIGSFHSEHPDVLLRQKDSEYEIPALPFESTIKTSTNFMLHRHDWTFLNHGAFGAVLQCAHDRANEWRTYSCHAQPLEFFDRHLIPHLVYSTRRIANFMNVHDNDDNINDKTNDHNDNSSTNNTNHNMRDGFTLIPNVTSGMNAILQGHIREYPNQKIVLWDISYGSTKKMAHAYYNNHHGRNHHHNNTGTTSNRVVEIPFQEKYMLHQHQQQQEGQQQLPSVDNEDMFLQAFEDTLSQQTQQQEDGNSDWTQNALFVVDHTTSNTAMTLPIERLCARAKEAGMITVVDGAHGLLAQDVNLTNLSSSKKSSSSNKTSSGGAGTGGGVVDIYLSNGHKWLSCPHGIGILYAPNPDIQNTILRYPAIISHGSEISNGTMDNSTLLSRFMWDGCRDYTAALTLPVVLDVWEQASPTLIRQWMTSKLISAITIMMETWYPQQLQQHYYLYKSDDNHDISSSSSSSSNMVEDWAGHVTLGSIPNIHTTSMALVKLPSHMNDHLRLWHPHAYQNAERKTSADAKHVQDFLYHHKIEVPIKCIHGILYVRLSCHIYNELEEYDHLAKVMMKYKKY